MSNDSPTAPLPDLALERRAIRRGASLVAGVDEAGRGPLAGPVVVAAVILNPRRVPAGLDDSKKLAPDVREELCEKLLRVATVSVAVAPPALIARLNILWATMWAMRQAVLGLAQAPGHLLIDGNMLPRDLPCSAEAVIGGDGRSVSIAAASIIAKVTRDRMCRIMDCEEPHFGFASHKGYSAPAHLAALTAHGPGRHHRLEFAPCAEALRARVSAEQPQEATAAA
ncbi:MAG TPA: ribonuclease HII [Devosiaceae bacterium]|jgi:ribonuclease HII|nr:ribonuclease HII [Devosiaceae bacterium]